MSSQIRKRSATLLVGLLALAGALAPVAQAAPGTSPGGPAQHASR
jgi:hypothetical protein